MNPRVGSGMQQAHEPPVEEAVAVVRNHEDGTSTARGSVGPKAADGATRTPPGVDTGRSCRWRGGLW